MEVEFIGSGGQGAVLGAELLSNAAVKAGYNAQSFASYGQARRGGKVEGYVRLSEEEIRVRAKIRQPDYLVIMEESFGTWAQKMNIIKKGATVLVNTPKPGSAFPFRRVANVVTINADAIATEKGVTLPSGAPVINTTILGALCGLLPLDLIDYLPEAFKELKIPAVEKNIAASREAYDRIKNAPEVSEAEEIAADEAIPVSGGHFPQYLNRPAPCQANCPAGEKIERTVYFVQHGHFEDALKNIKKENPFPGICGRVCFHPCEVNCNRVKYDEGIATQALERAAFDYADTGKLAKPEKKPSTGKTVGIIGSGPAGMTCAYYLTLLGHSVTVFEAEPAAGGIPRFGIPDYRLPKETVDREIQEIAELGIEIRVNTKVGEEIAFDTIASQYDACFIAAGAHRSMKLNVPGEDNPGVISGLELLKKVAFGDKVDLGKKVVVVGGGNSAVDSARTAKRLGADEVTIIYSRSAEEMLASATINEERCSGCKLCLDCCPCDAISFEEERKLAVIDEALCKGCGACASVCSRDAILRQGFIMREDVNAVEEEGINILYLATPVQIHSEDNRVSGIECVKVKLGEKNKSGRHKSELIQDSNFTIDTDTVIAAVGETLELPFTDGTVKMSGSVIEVDNLGRTSKTGVYAGGDAASLSRSVVEAIASGKRAALGLDLFLNDADQRTALFFREGNEGIISMDRYLAGDRTRQGNGVVSYKDLNVAYFEEQPRNIISELPVKTRIKNFNEACLGYTREEAIAEAERCFHCGHCTMCEICYIVCPIAAISLNPDGLSYTIKEIEGCQSCGICINECPRHAISWKGEVR